MTTRTTYDNGFIEKLSWDELGVLNAALLSNIKALEKKKVRSVQQDAALKQLRSAHRRVLRTKQSHKDRPKTSPMFEGMEAR